MLSNAGSLPADCYLSITLPNELCYINQNEGLVCLSDNMMFKLNEFTEPVNNNGKYLSENAALKACTANNKCGFRLDDLIYVSLDSNDGTEQAACCKYYALTVLIPTDKADDVNYSEEATELNISVKVFAEQHEDAPVQDENIVPENVVPEANAPENNAPENTAPNSDNAVSSETETEITKLVNGKLVVLKVDEEHPQLYKNARDAEDTAFYITTKEGLYMFRTLCAQGVSKDAVFYLADDIRFSKNDTFAPIKAFNATFDGGGHTISGIHCKVSSGDCGFFGQLNAGAKIQNLSFRRCSFEVRSNTGGDPNKALDGNLKAQPSCGTLAAVIASGSVQIENVNVIRGTVSCAYNAGGLIGKVINGGATVSKCAVSGVTVNGECYCGGVIGTAYSKLNVLNCVSQANMLSCTSDDNISGYRYVLRQKTVHNDDGTETVNEYYEYYSCWGLYYVDDYSTLPKNYHGTVHNGN